MEVDEKISGGDEQLTSPGGNEKAVRHHMPVIPTVMAANPRMAVSKASAKERVSPTKQFANIVSMEELDKQEVNSLPVPPTTMMTTTPTKTEDNDPRPPSSMPTPPSDGVPSEHSPKTNESMKDSTPVKSTEAAADSTTGTDSLDNSTPADKSDKHESAGSDPKRTPRAKTKGDIKKQLMKKKGQKSEGEKKEEGEGQAEVKPAKIKDVRRSSSVSLEGCQYMLGDMFWGKVSGHPWWPCMIAYDPFDTNFFKTQHNTKVYHVQYFGQEGERGWVPITRLQPYEGKTEHLEWLKVMSQKNKSKKKDYEINSRRRPAWNIACIESEEAFKLNRTERRARFTLSYSPVKKKGLDSDIVSPVGPSTDQGSSSSLKTGKKTKRKLSIDSGVSPSGDIKSPPKKKRKRTPSTSKVSPSKDSEKLANQTLTQFMVFCSKKRDGVRREHPTYTDAQIEKVLQEQWDKLPEEQRSKFIPMGSDVKNVSQMLPEDSPQPGSTSAKRTPKPSKKKMEAEESGGIVKSKRRDDTDSSATDTEVKKKRKKKEKDSEADEESSSGSTSGRDETAKAKNKLQGVMLDGEMFEPEIYSLIENLGIKKENICQLCEEQPGEFIICEGPCQGSFHVSCLGLKQAPDGPFKCDECVTGMHSCFVCKKQAADLKRCSVPSCGKFYHEVCIKKFHLTRFENGHIYCPLHTCATCAADNPKNSKASKGKMYRCVRCPTAYHASDFCVSAGSQNLTGHHIVCCRHFKAQKSQSKHSHVNVSWCFSCSRGGSLLCCETCPASFHIECLKIDEWPEGAWYCRDCASGKKPLYGDIVWVKIGVFRWWPGEICHPTNVPTNIQNLAHHVGEFPVKFFGSRDYYWMHQARVFLFQDGDKGCKDHSDGKSLGKVFQKAVKEGTLAYQMWKKFQELREEKQQQKDDKKPAPYKHIKTNKPVGNVTVYTADPSEVPRCECHPAMDHPCGDYSDCINRMTLEECHPLVCPAGDRCQNQRFQKREYVDAVPFKTEGRGWGLVAQQDVKKGQFVNEYVGELVDEEEAKRRFKQADEDGVTNFYMLTLDPKRIIDAGPKGNLSRFMNHSCAPNCITQKWTVNGDVRIGLFANQDIPKGSELTFNYNLDCLGNEKKKCSCGAPTCSGFLGVKAKKEEQEKAPKIKKKKKHKKAVGKMTENDCYRCGDGGELVMCDRSSCPKVYHLKCLKLNKMPHGKWLCPWHHCDVCGKAAIKLCSECPNSFCHMHIEGNIFGLPDGKLVCEDHDDILQAVEASKLENEPNGKVLSSSSEAASTCSSSPPHSDSDASAMDPMPPSGNIMNQKQLETATGSESDSTTADIKPVMNKKGRKSKRSDVASAEDIMDSMKTEMFSSPKQEAGTESGSTQNGVKQESGVKQEQDTVLPNGNGVKSEQSSTTATGVVESDMRSPENSSKKKGKGRKSATLLGGESKSTPSGKSSKGKQNGEDQSASRVDTPMFEDTDSDEFPNLVIDIPQ